MVAGCCFTCCDFEFKFAFGTRALQIQATIFLICIAFPRRNAHWRILRHRSPYIWMLGIQVIQYGVLAYHVSHPQYCHIRKWGGELPQQHLGWNGPIEVELAKTPFDLNSQRLSEVRTPKGETSCCLDPRNWFVFVRLQPWGCSRWKHDPRSVDACSWRDCWALSGPESAHAKLLLGMGHSAEFYSIGVCWNPGNNLKFIEFLILYLLSNVNPWLINPRVYHFNS